MNASANGKSIMKTWKRRLLRGAIGFILLLAGAVCVLWLSLRGSLPPLDGQEPADVEAPVTLERDTTGIVTIRAKDEGDLYFGLGYAHGQDRFFSMDLQRRVAAGELSELFGKETLEHDRFIRLLGIQAHVRSVLNQLGDPERLKLARYTAGVNAGLASLSVRPFPYLLLRMPPRQWVEEDCLFVAMSMYVSLQDFTGDSQLIEQAVHNRLGPDIWAFLYRNGHAGSRPLNEDPIPIIAPPDEGWLPGPGEEPSTEAPDDQTPGSNAFAVGSA